MLFEKMIVELQPKDVPGAYDESAQQWSEPCDAARSPQKHHQEN